MSITVLTALVALFPATKLWPGVDRLLGAFFSKGGGAIGVAILLLPLMLALAVLGFVHFARRLDPTISFVRGLGPLVLWGASFGILMLVVP